MVFCMAGGDRAEAGLLPFARVALEVATADLPPYRSPFSKHRFPQPEWGCRPLTDRQKGFRERRP